MEKNLKDKELANVTGGTDIDPRKDLYENIILSVPPEEHNVMLNNALESEMKVICPYCFFKVPISKIDAHKEVCSKNADMKSGWIG